MRSSLLVSFVFRVLTRFLYPLALLLLHCPLYTYAYDVVFAVNCGGPKHTDRNGIHYKADNNPMGIPSTFGRSLSISRVHPEDMILYQTERYHTSSFSYSIPIEEEGEYVLVTKYSEVYFQHLGGKVCCIEMYPSGGKGIFVDYKLVGVEIVDQLLPLRKIL